MNRSQLFILRPVGTSLFMAAILLTGLVANTFLPLSARFPRHHPRLPLKRLPP